MKRRMLLLPTILLFAFACNKPKQVPTAPTPPPGNPMHRRLDSIASRPVVHVGLGDCLSDVARLMAAIERVTADPRFHTPDLGGKASTADLGKAIAEAI